MKTDRHFMMSIGENVQGFLFSFVSREENGIKNELLVE